MLALGACARDEPRAAGDVPARLAAAQEATEQAGSARAAMTFTISAEESPSVEFVMEGVMDLDAGAARMSGDLSGLPGARGRLTMIIVDGTAYLRAPALGFGRGEQRWIRTDLASVPAAGGGFTQDPAQSLTFLSGVVDARETGEQELRGEPTTRYEGVIDPALVSAEHGGEVLRQAGVEEIPFKAWIDGDGRLRKLELSVRGGSPSSEARVRIVFELWDFGTEADIRPPPAEKIMEAGKPGS